MKYFLYLVKWNFLFIIFTNSFLRDTFFKPQILLGKIVTRKFTQNLKTETKTNRLDLEKNLDDYQQYPNADDQWDQEARNIKDSEVEYDGDANYIWLLNCVFIFPIKKKTLFFVKYKLW